MTLPIVLNEHLKTSLNLVTRLYYELRPGYPEQLVEDVIALSGITENGTILEIGCGTGKATFPFATRGYSMVCLELAEDVAAWMMQKYQSHSDVNILPLTFEDWPLQKATFDLVIAGSAFHFIPPEISYPKAAKALKDSGSIALFWNYHSKSDTPFYQALDELYGTKAPQITTPASKIQPEALIQKTIKEISSSGCFGKILAKCYSWSKVYTADEYILLLNMYSDHLKLDKTTRYNLFIGIRGLIEEFGGFVDKPFLATLYLAKVNR